MHVSTATATTPFSSTVNLECSKCGTNKAGKRSCCGRGGSWAGKCGNEVNEKFDHTWGEGVQACEIESKQICLQMCMVGTTVSYIVSVYRCCFANTLVLQCSSIAPSIPLQCLAHMHAGTTKSTVTTTRPAGTINKCSPIASIVLRRQRPYSVCLVPGCAKWCASHKQAWKVKCTWSKRCDGCSECSG